MFVLLMWQTMLKKIDILVFLALQNWHQPKKKLFSELEKVNAKRKKGVRH